MIYLRLFLSFLKIGAVAFGGGYGMISLIRDDCLAQGWLTEDQLLDYIAVAESTPGPIAVNMATFVGSAQAGIGGAILATLGVVLPAFLIILLIVLILGRVLQLAGVKATFASIRPAIVGMLLATACIMFVSIIFGIKTIHSTFSFDWKSLIIFAMVAAIYYGIAAWRKKTFPPILLVIIAGLLGWILFDVL